MKKTFLTIVYALLGAAVVYVLFADVIKKKDDPDTITVWHWMTDRHEALRELAAQHRALTGTKVRIDLFAPSDAYSKKVTASSQAKILPDIFGILDTKDTFAQFVKYGYVADLTDEFEKDGAQWKNEFFPKALSSNTFEAGNSYGVKPGIYGVPLDVTNLQVLYNKKLLEKAGYSQPPFTFQEFIEVGLTLKRLGIPVLVSGWGEAWMVECFASNYAFNIMGEEKVMATYRGEVPYTDPDWIRVFGVFKTLVDNGLLIDGVVAKPNKEAEQDFALERAAFAFNGSWSVNVYNEMNPSLDYGVMPPPVFSFERPIRIWGGAGSSLVVNDHSTKKVKAVAFLKWLTEKEQQEYLARNTNNLPSNRNAFADVPDILEGFAKGMPFATHPSIWELNELPIVTERFGKGLQAILLGKKTPEQVAQEVQAVKEREMARAENRKR